MEINKIKYVKNLKVNERKFMRISLGLVLVGGSFLTSNYDNIVGLAMLCGGICCADVAQKYRNMEEEYILSEKKLVIK